MATMMVGDAALYYRELGTGTPLLLIHGTGGRADDFDGAIEVLAGVHRVIVYDRRGHARSNTKPAAVKGYLKQQAEDAAALLQRLGTGPAAIVGWSMGGLIALCLALEHPQLVSRLVVCEPPFHTVKHMPLRSVAPFLKALFLSAIGCKRAAVATFLRMTLRGPNGDSAFDGLDDDKRRAVLENAEILLHELKTGTGEELTAERLKQLQCPITAIVGEETNRLFSDAMQRLSEILPQMRVTRVPDAGHLLVLSHAATFARLALQQ